MVALREIAPEPDGSLDEAVTEALASRDGEALGRSLRALDAAAVQRIRGSFASFGCCGVTDPLRELAALGLLDGADLPASRADARPADAREDQR